MESKPGNHLSWWVDVALFLAGPVLVTGAAWFRGPLNELAVLSLFTTAVFSIALTMRLVTRWGSSAGQRVLLGLFLVCVVAFLVFSMTFVGCAVGLNHFNRG